MTKFNDYDQCIEDYTLSINWILVTVISIWKKRIEMIFLSDVTMQWVRVNEFANKGLLACMHRKLIFIPRRISIAALYIYILMSIDRQNDEQSYTWHLSINTVDIYKPCVSINTKQIALICVHLGRYKEIDSPDICLIDWYRLKESILWTGW
jgi:hypothetical protein